MPRLIRVRATINLPRLRAGAEVLADADDPYVRTCLKRGYLVPVNAAGGRETP